MFRSWFKDHAQSGGYQTEINPVRLRRYVRPAHRTDKDLAIGSIPLM